MKAFHLFSAVLLAASTAHANEQLAQRPQDSLRTPTAATGSALDLRSAFRMALNTHPLMRSRRQEETAAGFDREGADWGRFPSLSGEISQLARHDPPNTLDRSATQGTIKIQQPLWTSGKLTAQIDSAKARETAASQAVTEAGQQLLLQVAASFTDLVRAGRKSDVAASSMAEHERLRDMMQRRTSGDVSAKVDGTLALARLQQAQTELGQFRNSAQVARATLGQLVGVPVQNAVAPTVDPSRLEDPARLREEAFAYSPELARLRAVVDDATAQTTLARATYRPQLVVGHEYRMGELLFGQARNQTFLSLQMQTGAGFSARSGVEAATARRLAAEESIEAAKRRIAQQVDAEWSDMTTARSQVRLFAELVEGTREVAESYLRLYTVGRKNWMDVMNGTREFAQARYSLADSEIALLLASVRLDILTGRIGAGTGGQ